MRLFVDRGTLSYVAPGLTQEPTADQVVFDGQWIEGQMVWDAGLDNVRQKNAAELLAEAKAERRAEVNAERRRREEAGFAYMGATFDSDERSYLRMLGGKAAAEAAIAAGAPFSVDWTTADNATMTMTAQQVLGMVPTFAARALAIHAAAKALKGAVDACTTVEQVAALDITQGWPQ